jgi:hypothetical protein
VERQAETEQAVGDGARITYRPISRLVDISSKQATITMSDPQIIGLRGPNRCRSFSPTRIKAMMKIA